MRDGRPIRAWMTAHVPHRAVRRGLGERQDGPGVRRDGPGEWRDGPGQRRDGAIRGYRSPGGSYAGNGLSRPASVLPVQTTQGMGCRGRLVCPPLQTAQEPGQEPGREPGVSRGRCWLGSTSSPAAEPYARVRRLSGRRWRRPERYRDRDRDRRPERYRDRDRCRYQWRNRRSSTAGAAPPEQHRRRSP